MKLGFNSIIKAVKGVSIKQALIVGGAVVALALVKTLATSDDDDCEEIDLDAEIVDIEAEIIDDLKED